MFTSLGMFFMCSFCVSYLTPSPPLGINRVTLFSSIVIVKTAVFILTCMCLRGWQVVALVVYAHALISVKAAVAGRHVLTHFCPTRLTQHRDITISLTLHQPPPTTYILASIYHSVRYRHIPTFFLTLTHTCKYAHKLMRTYTVSLSHTNPLTYYRQRYAD